MIGHLGSRVTALLDGRLDGAEEERIWEHVHACHPCRDAVEREGWVKTQLAQWGAATAPDAAALRESLLSRSHMPGPVVVVHEGSVRPRHMVALGGSALGVAVLGVLALGAIPSNAPLPDRRTATTSIVPPSASPSSAVGARGGVTRSAVQTTGVQVLIPHGTMVP